MFGFREGLLVISNEKYNQTGALPFFADYGTEIAASYSFVTHFLAVFTN